MQKFIVIVILLAVFHGIATEDCADVEASNESKLHKRLMCNYDKDNRPVKNHNTAVNITVRMLLRLLYYSHQFASSESITIKCWLIMKWKDEYLTWAPDDYGGLKEILIHSSRLWIPDFSLYNSPKSEPMKFDYPCLVSNEGLVICIPQLSRTATCNMEYKNWPHDRQNCTLFFGTWMHKGEQVNYNLHPNPISLADYQRNKYWKLVSANASRNPGIYSKTPNQTFPTLRFNFVIERYTSSLIAKLLVPAIGMITMTIVSLCLNIISMERIVVMFFNVACHFFYMNELNFFLPSNGDVVPDIVIYFRDTTILVSVVLFEGVILKNLVNYTKVTPSFVLKVTSLMQTGAGKIVFHEFDPNTVNIEEGENLTEDPKTTASNQWKKFTLFINRTFSIAVIFTYFILIIVYVT